MNDYMTGADDEVLLASLERKLDVLRDRTRGLAKGYYDGVYVHGPGGTGKSYTVETTLKEVAGELGRTPDDFYTLTNSRITAKALFTQLRDHPDRVHAFEDIEGLMQDPTAAGILRAALWGQRGADGKPVRRVTWKTGAGNEEVVFTGGILVLANAPLPDLPEMAAAQTRFVYHEFRPTAPELAAKLRQSAGRGYSHKGLWLEPAPCLEVAERVIGQCGRHRRPLNFRLLEGALKDRLQWQQGEALTHWTDLVDSRVREEVAVSGRQPEADREARLLDAARRVRALPPSQQLTAWQGETGMSRATMFRWLKKLR